jgi:predicted PurR-regulated permease PerM
VIEINKVTYSKYFFLSLFLGLIYLSYKIVKPLVSPIIIAALLVYIFNPIYKGLNNKIKRKNLSSLIMTIAIILIITIPFIFVLNSIIKEAAITSVIASQKISTGNIFGVRCTDKDNFLCGLSERVKNFASDPKKRYYIDSTIKGISSFVTGQISGFIIAVPRRIFDIVVLFFVMFYLFRDKDMFIKKIKELLPIKQEYKEQIIKQINEVTSAIIYGYLIVGVIQGTILAILFFIFGLSSPILWGILMMILSILPVIGPTIIWIPGSILLFISGYMEGNTGLAIKGIILLLFGLFIFTPIDNIVKPKMIGNKTKIHSTFIIIGLIGGIIMFGFIGFVIGPLILALLVTFIDIYEKEKQWFKQG